MFFGSQFISTCAITALMTLSCAYSSGQVLTSHSEKRSGEVIATSANDSAFAAVGLPLIQAEQDLAGAERNEDRKLPNPTVDFSYRQNGKGSVTDLSVMEDITGLVSNPWKRGASNARYRAAMSRIAGERSDRILKTKTAYYRAIAAEQTRTLWAEAASSVRAAAELARRQRAAGTMNALDLTQFEAAEVEAGIALTSAETQAQTELEELSRTLLVSPEDLNLPDSLPSLPSEDPDVSALEQTAMKKNPEILAANEDVSASMESTKLSNLTYLPSLQAGVVTEWDHGQNLIGPALSVEVPIFNWGGAARARASAERDIKHHHLNVMQVEIPSEVRSKYRTLITARQNFETLRDKLIPLRERATSETVKQYNFGLAGVYQLLAVRREETVARREAVEMQRDYWIARVELERIAGGELP